ncbi:MAG: type VI secretion system baseplate subunit TssE [Candidatus Accumulibacter sp.]|jgi:type VI secretion system lysozyme-like protein|nr:type VI secretion system baseplate subunit TssE [Accumulibacter sp.]
MVKLRLFERMSAAAKNKEGNAPPTGDALLQSICDYVAKLLNSREGSTLLDPTFGMPDFTHSGAVFSADDEPLLRQKIAQFIRANEPRLKNIQIAFVPREETHSALSFSISAQLREDRESTGDDAAVHFYSDVSPQGKVDVRL